MLIGLGIDLAEVGFWRKALANPATAVFEGSFTAAERGYCLTAVGEAAEHFAARFAAKEAFIKAIGGARTPAPPLVKTLDLCAVEVIRDAFGRPSLSLHGAAAQMAQTLGVQHIWLSLTHTGDTAGAVVVLES